MSELNPFVPDVHFEQIPICNLVSNQDYQRALSLKHIRKAAEHFDPFQINPVKVSRRDGINYVFNGQHTIEIVAAVSGSRETPVWCMVYEDLKYETEADIFANQQKYVKSLSPYEIFVANVEAGNDEQLIIKGLVESYGLNISHGKVPGAICCVSSLEAIFENYGYQVLDRTLKLVIGTWEGDINSLSANMIRGVAKLVSSYGDALKDDIFREKLGSHSVREIGRIAKDRKVGSMGYAEAMLIMYNKNFKTGLKWSKLYSSKKHIPYDVQDYEEEQVDESEEESLG